MFQFLISVFPEAHVSSKIFKTVFIFRQVSIWFLLTIILNSVHFVLSITQLEKKKSRLPENPF